MTTTDTGRLLVLDDDILIGRTIRAMAESVGFQVCLATDPQQFFEALEAWGPTHIALDLVMPQMDGVQVLGQLAERGCTCAIIITSGVGHRVLDAAARSGGERGLTIAGVLSKPFSLRRFRELLGAGSDPWTTPPSEPASASAPVDLGRLEAALEQGMIRVAYQPKIHTRSGALAGFEALARWHEPDGSQIPPGVFIPFAERAGGIEAITQVVLEQSQAWFAENFCGAGAGSHAERGVTMSVNLSARTLGSDSFIDLALDGCLRHGISPSQMIFELTESSAMDDPVASLDVLTRLRMKGFQLAVDDFGTGYSSMLQLARLPFSEIKVDRSFVMAAHRSDEARVVVRSIVELGRSMGLFSTAEGVEREDTLDFLREVGCDLSQGFHIGRPMPPAEALAWVEKRFPDVPGG